MKWKLKSHISNLIHPPPTICPKSKKTLEAQTMFGFFIIIFFRDSHLWIYVLHTFILALKCYEN